MRRRNSLLALSLGAVLPLASAPAFAQGTPVPSPSEKMPTDKGNPDYRTGQGPNEMVEPSKERHSTGGTKTELESSDMNFVKKVGQANLAEIKLSELAKERGSSPKVKEFAQTVIDDHTSAQSQLKTIAQDKGVMLPTDMTAEQQATYDKISKLSGSEFDKAYMNQMVKDHHVAMSLYQKESTSGHDPDLKSFAEKTLPTVKQRSKTAERDVKTM